MSDEALQRRSDDRDRLLNDRLDRLEKQYERAQATVNALESSVNTVKLEQTHMREIVDARLRMIEKSGDLHASKLDEVKTLISTQGDAADKSPAGREMLAKVRDVETTCGEHSQTLADHEKWQNQIDGSIKLLVWLAGGGMAGVIGLVLWLLRAAKV